MKKIPTEQAVGHVLCHDLTQIIPGVQKGPRFRKGHIVEAADIPVLLSMGKEHLYVWEMTPGMVHENDAAERLCALCRNEHMTPSPVKEGKMELTAAINGLFLVDSARLRAVNQVPDMVIATRHGYTPVQAGDTLCGVRVVPLAVREDALQQAEAAAGDMPLLSLLPYQLKTAGIISTGSEVAKGRIADAFTPIVKAKLAAYGIAVTECRLPGDEPDNITTAIYELRQTRVDLILCLGGMSVDPDDNTPSAIRQSGAEIVSYGAPVLPGSMFLIGYYPDGTPVMGLPGCVMHDKATVFDRILPRVAAGVRICREDIIELGEGGLCLRCHPCVFPHCPFAL